MQLKKIMSSFLKVGGVIGAIGGIFYFNQKSLKRMREMYEQQKSYYAVAQQWLLNNREGKEVKAYFTKHNYKTIAIYGMGTMGELLYNELKGTEVSVEFFIDKNAEDVYSGLDDLPVKGIDAVSEQPVDIIVVTPIYYFDEIVTDLENENIKAEIISLEDIIYEI